jgi:hypothetical protein
MRQPLHLELEFDAETDPIAGILTSSNGPQPFTGWLALIAGVEHALGAWRQEDLHTRQGGSRCLDGHEAGK